MIPRSEKCSRYNINIPIHDIRFPRRAENFYPRTLIVFDKPPDPGIREKTGRVHIRSGSHDFRCTVVVSTLMARRSLCQHCDRRYSIFSALSCIEFPMTIELGHAASRRPANNSRFVTDAHVPNNGTQRICISSKSWREFAHAFSTKCL